MPGRLSSTWMRRAGMAYQRSGADDGSATLSSPLLERSAKEGSGDGRHRRMARRDLRRASDQRPPPRLLLAAAAIGGEADRSEEHTSELQSLMRISYAVFCLKKKKQSTQNE